MVTVNLPVGSIKSIINIDDPNVNVSIEDAIELLNSSDKAIRSMYSMPETCDNPRGFGKIINYTHDINYITKISKKPITSSNVINYHELVVRFNDNKEYTFIFPSFVKLFSRTTKTFVPVEYVKKSDMLIDWQNLTAQVLSNNPVNFNPEEYYNIIINANDNSSSTFYINGLLSYVYYNNFRDKEKAVEE
jgi:hypothetical protein